ncbi:hypothetical protein PC123_g3149 [Phytophthora cactorum]|nr:hypothetical protein PC123_g3149 [Phytophthora cactorum]
MTSSSTAQPRQAKRMKFRRSPDALAMDNKLHKGLQEGFVSVEHIFSWKLYKARVHAVCATLKREGS